MPDDQQLMIPNWLVQKVGALVVELEAARAELQSSAARISELEQKANGTEG